MHRRDANARVTAEHKPSAPRRYWAGVQQLQNQLFSIIGDSLFALGLWLVRRYFLNASWRVMLLTTSVLLNLIDMPFVFLTVFDVVRNQYFYLGETVLVEVTLALLTLTITLTLSLTLTLALTLTMQGHATSGRAKLTAEVRVRFRARARVRLSLSLSLSLSLTQSLTLT